MASVIPKQPKKVRDQITHSARPRCPPESRHDCWYLDSISDYVIHRCLALFFASIAHSRIRAPAKDLLPHRGPPGVVAVEAAGKSVARNPNHRRLRDGCGFLAEVNVIRAIVDSRFYLSLILSLGNGHYIRPALSVPLR